MLKGAKTDELLHRLILLGDGVGAEFLLRSCDDVAVTPVVVELTKRLKYADTCTFTMASHHNPISQYM